MNKEQLKKEIHEAIDKLPENVLPDILNYINTLNRITSHKSKSSDEKKFREFIIKIFNEDADLLKRLSDT